MEKIKEYICNELITFEYGKYGNINNIIIHSTLYLTPNELRCLNKLETKKDITNITDNNINYFKKQLSKYSDQYFKDQTRISRLEYILKENNIIIDF